MNNKDLNSILEPAVVALGCELWACEFLSQGTRSLLRVYIDKPTGVTIDDCTRVTRQINVLLDVEDPIPGHYTLEVSSPGLDRPLFTAAHFQKYIGNKVTIKLKKPINKTRKFTAVLEKFENDTITILIDGEGVIIPLADIIKANLVV